MKRHAALQDLSRDHHVILILAKEMRDSLAEGGEAPGRAGQRFLTFWRTDMQAHIQEEETLLLPLLRAQWGAEDLRLRTVLDDHRWIRGRVPDLTRALDRGQDATPLVGALGSRLAQHVRFEENEVFHGAQVSLNEAAIGHLGDASQKYRAENRDAAGCRLP